MKVSIIVKLLVVIKSTLRLLYDLFKTADFPVPFSKIKLLTKVPVIVRSTLVVAVDDLFSTWRPLIIISVASAMIPCVIFTSLVCKAAPSAVEKPAYELV